MFFLRRFQKKWRDSVREAFRRNARDREERQAFDSFLSETAAKMKISTETLSAALERIGKPAGDEARSALEDGRRALAELKKNLETISGRIPAAENLKPDSVQDEIQAARPLSEEDIRLMEDLREIIRQDASNPDLDISLICRRLHISRSKLYYKVSSISGESPKEFLRQYRLELASTLLSEGKMNVSEVADAVGFNSSSYFSKAFKKKYGVLPSEKLQ